MYQDKGAWVREVNRKIRFILTRFHCIERFPLSLIPVSGDKNVSFLLEHRGNLSYFSRYQSLPWALWPWVVLFCFVLKTLFIFREGKGGRKRGRETSMCGCLSRPPPLLGTWAITQACALTGNRTSNPLVRRLTLNPLSHTSQGWSCVFIPLHLLD